MSRANRIVALITFSVVGVTAVGSFLRTPSPTDEPPPPPQLLPAAFANPAVVTYQDTLHQGETLSGLLQRSRLGAEEAARLLAELQEHQNPRRLRPGAVISYRRGFVDGEVRAMAFSLDRDRTLLVRRGGESWSVVVEEVPVRLDTISLAGAVRSSLYQALLEGEGAEVPPEEREGVADVLADEIFAWQIDFSRDLREGDSYQILYEREVRPDGSARSSRILGAVFDLSGKEFSAFRFRTPGGSEDFYDREGESLRRAFLRAPLEFRRISSSYSTSRFHPILKRARAHHGIDYAAAAGTPIRAVGDGVVAKAGWGGGYGNVVEIRHSRGYGSRYAHLRGFAKGLRGGARVRQGDLIGYVGTTGLSTGPHLHYEFHSGGRPINPNTIRSITGDPVPSGARALFRERVHQQIAAMETKSSHDLLARADAPAAPERGD